MFGMEEAQCPGEKHVHPMIYYIAQTNEPFLEQTIMRSAAVPAFLKPMPFTKVSASVGLASEIA